jgi:hypothetical protein
MKLRQTIRKIIKEAFLKEETGQPGATGLPPERNPFANKDFLEDKPLTTQVKGGTNKFQEKTAGFNRADLDDKGKTVIEVEDKIIKDLKGKGVKLMVNKNTIPKFNIGRNAYTISNPPWRYFNLTKMKFVSESGMNKVVTIFDLGQEFKVPFFWAASNLGDRAIEDWGSESGLNMAKRDRSKSLLNITHEKYFFVGSKYTPDKASLLDSARKLREIEKIALSQKQENFNLKDELNIFRHEPKTNQHVVNINQLTVDIVYSKSKNIEISSNGKIKGLLLKTVNIISGKTIRETSLSSKDLTELINSIDNRLIILKKVLNSSTNFSNARA